MKNTRPNSAPAWHKQLKNKLFKAILTDIEKKKIALDNVNTRNELLSKTLLQPAAGPKNLAEKQALIEYLIKHDALLVENNNPPLLHAFMASASASFDSIDALINLFNLLLNSLTSIEQVTAFANPENAEGQPILIEIISSLANAKQANNTCAYQLMFSVLNALLEKGLHPDTIKNNRKDTLFIAAAAMDLTELMSLLIKYGANPLHTNNDGETALLVCAYSSPLGKNRYENIAAVSYILAKTKIGIDTPDKNGTTPLIKAIEENKENLIKLLLNNKAQVNIKDNIGNTPLICAANLNNSELMHLLLEKYQANPNLFQEGYASALSLATANQNVAMVRLLFKHGAQWNLIINANQGNAFHVALSTKNSELIQIFHNVIEKCAQFLDKDILYYTIFYQDKLTLLYLLQNLAKFNININAMIQPKLDTALGLAIFQKAENIVPSLLYFGADKYLEFGAHSTNAIHWACAVGNLNIVKQLIISKVDANIKNKYGFTPLMIAALNNQLEISRYLLNKEADPNALNQYGHHALSIAALLGRTAIIQLLLQHTEIKPHLKVPKFSLNTSCEFKNLSHNSSSELLIGYQVAAPIINSINTNASSKSDILMVHYLYFHILQSDLPLIEMLMQQQNFTSTLGFDDFYSFMLLSIALGNKKLLNIFLDSIERTTNPEINKLAKSLNLDPQDEKNSINQLTIINDQIAVVTLRKITHCTTQNLQPTVAKSLDIMIMPTQQESSTSQSGTSYLLKTGYTIDKINEFKKNNKKNRPPKKHSFFKDISQSQNDHKNQPPATWLNNQLKLPCDAISEVEGCEQNKYYYYIAPDDCILAQGCSKESLALFKKTRIKFSETNFKFIKDIEIKGGINLNGHKFYDFYTHELIIEGKERLAGIALLSDTKQHVLYIIFKYLPNGIHTLKDLKSLEAETKIIDVNLPLNNPLKESALNLTRKLSIG